MKKIVLPEGWGIDELIVWAHRPDIFDEEPMILDLDNLPELSAEDRQALEKLGNPEEFIGRLIRRIECESS